MPGEDSEPNVKSTESEIVERIKFGSVILRGSILRDLDSRFETSYLFHMCSAH